MKALAALGARRIALLTPYLDGPSRLIEGFFAEHGGSRSWPAPASSSTATRT